MSNFLALTNSRLIDGRGGAPAEGVTVVIADGEIKEISENASCLKADRVIDLAGRTVLPGLIDAHVHPNTFDLDPNRIAALSWAEYALRTAKVIADDLQHGFTTLRDAAMLEAGFARCVEQGLLEGPRLRVSVRHLMQTSGAKIIGLEGDHPNLTPLICDGPDEVRRAARSVLATGADQVKVMASGEVVSSQPTDRARPIQEKFSICEIAAAVETAEAAGTYVMAHAYTPRAILNCIEAGVRSIEHGNLMDAETAARICEKGAFYVPTLSIYDVLARELRDQMSPLSLDKLAEVADYGRRAVELALQAGVKIASGSDIIGPYQNLKGRELRLKAEVMTPMKAIVSATRINAELLNLDDRLGTIEPGKLADLIVVEGDPLTNPALFEDGRRNVLLVMKAGRIYKNCLG